MTCSILRVTLFGIARACFPAFHPLVSSCGMFIRRTVPTAAVAAPARVP